jgi:hypothetical protein
MEEGLVEILDATAMEGVVSRIGSAFCTYYMNFHPTNWYDSAQ